MKEVKRWFTTHSTLGLYAVRQSMQHRFSFFSSFLIMLIQPVIVYAIWQQVFLDQSVVANLSGSDMVTYLIISQSINCMYGFQSSTERQIMSRVRSGDIALDLVKPLHFVGARFFETFGFLLIQLAFSLFLVMLALFLFPAFRMPSSLWTFFPFLVSVFLGFMILFSISMMTGMISFKTLNITGIVYGRKAIVDFFSGALIPISLFPTWLTTLSKFLPFQGIIYIPTMIFLEKMSARELVLSLASQFLWVFILLGLSSIVCKRAMRKVTIHGG